MNEQNLPENVSLPQRLLPSQSLVTLYPRLRNTMNRATAISWYGLM